ncbi:hypothetical protein [Burkholderia sp. MS455]|uniref:hypothetical protein n=1 Tax=Burkholderia sp. MS455 TaxID=2811788 RepID=UPI001EF45B9D|nr:hypothetical protein [Burkholderia sp. MS455]
MYNESAESNQVKENAPNSVDSVAEFEVFFARLRQAIGTDDLYGWGKSRGFPRQTLYNMVSGQKIPGLETLRKFRDETGKPIGWLLGEDVLHPGAPTESGAGQVDGKESDEFVYIPRYPPQRDQRASDNGISSLLGGEVPPGEPR